MGKVGRFFARLSGVEFENETIAATESPPSTRPREGQTNDTELPEEAVNQQDLEDLGAPEHPDTAPPIYANVPQPVKVPARQKPAGSYIDKLHKPLFHLSKRDPVNMMHLLSHTIIFGGTGMGKSSGSGRTYAKSLLSAGWGGLVLCAKNDEAQTWLRYAKQTGRSKDIIHVKNDGDWCFNFIDYEMFRDEGNPSIRVENIKSTLKIIVEQMGRTDGGGDSKHWQDQAERLLNCALYLLVANPSRNFRLFDIQKMIDYAPRNEKEVREGSWKTGYFGQCYQTAQSYYQQHGMMHKFEILESFWLYQFARMHERTRTSVTNVLGTMIQDMMLGTIADLFLSGTNFIPDDAFEGAVILLDLPTVNNETNRLAQILFKTVWQQAVLRRENAQRPTFLYADEYPEFVSKADERFARMARSHKAGLCVMAQDVGSLQKAFSGHTGQSEARSFTQQFQTLIFHATNDVDVTAKWASDLVGETREILRSGNMTSNENETLTTSRTHRDEKSFEQIADMVNRRTSMVAVQQTKSKSKGSSETFGWQEQFRKELTPEKLLTLPKGNTSGTGVVGAYILRTGETFSNGKPYIYSEFSQKF